MPLEISTWTDLEEEQRRTLLQRPVASQKSSVRISALEIIAAVRSGGDESLIDLTQKFDGVSVDSFRVADWEIEAARAELTAVQIAAIDLAIENVQTFHEQQLPSPISIETMPGVRCERISQALDSVGLYVPAGTAPLPSAAVMLAVPAIIAGCPNVVLCTPPRSDGSVDPAVLIAATRAGVSEIYKVGGAQAIAAMAYGTASIPKVRKIFGPGNAWVTAAKTIVSSDPDGAAIDMPAGPSEVLVIADSGASAEFVAADLLSQAEHGVDSQVLLISTDVPLADAVLGELEDQLQGLARADTAMAALNNSQIIVAPNLATAVEISNQYAPEHLILQVASPRDILPDIRNAGW